MRVKQREDGATRHDETYVVITNGVQTGGGASGSFTEPPFGWERISYGVGRKNLNPCLHIKYKFTPHLNRIVRLAFSSPPSAPNSYQEWYDSYVNPAYLYGPDTPPQPPAPQLGVSQFVLRGIQHIRPKFVAKDFSLPNFIFEMKDLRRILPTKERLMELYDIFVKGSGTVLPRALTSKEARRRLRKYHKRRSRRDKAAGDEIANQYLNAQFGWGQLMRDVYNFKQATEAFNIKLLKFKGYAGKPQKGNYKEVVPRSFGSDETIGSNYYSVLTRATDFSAVKYVLTLRYKYYINIPIIETPYLLKRYMGIRDNPEALWDAIPFSFIIDWCIRVGDSLRALDAGAIPVELVITDACVSKAYTAVNHCHIADVPNSFGSANYGARYLLANEGWVVYDRSVLDKTWITEAIPPLPVVDHLSTKEITLALALGRKRNSGN